MKIERVNDRQIRCTLTGKDLSSRQLKISELAYGSEKAKSLFRDMMKQAEHEFGFVADDIPLVIEAIPVNADSIILIITKVDDPEELDTRFSKFAPSVSVSDEEESDTSNLSDDFARGMINMLREMRDTLEKVQPDDSAGTEDKTDSGKRTSPCTLCAGLDELNSFAKSVAGFYHAHSSLYKDEEGRYHLYMDPEDTETRTFARVCNIASEFGLLTPAPASRISYIKEHFDVIIPEKAVEALLQV
ncbi:MAG: adaptor protein MecA [Lachnospiraceae bacterium]|nr:adaptor protein MecA [Lachnospiraceae bacterium]